MSRNSFVQIKLPPGSVNDPWLSKTGVRRRISQRNFRMLVPILLLLSLVMNVYYITRPRPLKLPELLEKMYEKEQNAGESGSQLDSNIRTIDYSEYTDLIVVPGHSIYNGKGSPLKKNNWILKEWQKNDVGVYLKHIARSIEILKEHDSSLLLFSGGVTRRAKTVLSEAQGYWNAAERLGWITPELYGRVLTEDYSRDSYENLMYSICRFKEVTGNYPDRISVVGFEFKRYRFENLHRKAIKYPRIRFNYVGIDPTDNVQEAIKDEKKNGYERFEQDLYGCRGELDAKRRERNPFNRQHGYHTSCKELRELIEYCPEDGVNVFEGNLPWDV